MISGGPLPNSESGKQDEQDIEDCGLSLNLASFNCVRNFQPQKERAIMFILYILFPSFP